MKKLIFICTILIAGAAAASAGASSPFDIEFPIPELGGCADKDACKAYCNDATHGVACAEFAQKHGLGDQKTVQAARAVEAGGPGGCRSEQECRAYCEDTAHEVECVEFGVSKGFMTRAEADRILRPGPGGCRGRACQQYCQDPAHQEECFEYAAANDLIPKEELKRIKEFKEKFKKNETGPGGCRGEQACRQYCEDPAHITECVSFAEENGFVDKEQAKIIKKTVGKGPGGCKGPDACRAYCEDTAHQTECIEFGEKNGFMTADEAARARKFAGKTGPGGCQGAACKDFCNQPGNEEQCLEFAEREDILPKEELARAKKFMAAARDGGPGGCRGVQCRNYCEDPAHKEECFGFAKKQGLISKEEEEHFAAGAKIEEVVKTSGGPGGCKDDNACRAYCMDPSHVEECVAFGATHGGVPPEKVREMLKQFTERRFEARGGDFGPGGFEDFQRFESDSGRRFEEFRQLEEQFRGNEFPGFGGFSGGPPGGFPGSSGEFPGGAPGGFPGGPGGAAFAGPGGCASPAECIRYCTEHRDECFSGGSSGEHGSRQEGDDREGVFQGEHEDVGFGPSFGPPRLRGGLIHEFEKGELPEGFHQLPPEEREQFFHREFPQFNPPAHGQFPGEGGFPGGAPGEFPGQFPQSFPGHDSGSLEELQRLQQDAAGGGVSPEQIERLRSLQHVPNKEGGTPLPQGLPGGFGGELRPPEGFHPPEAGALTPPASGGIVPPSGSFTPPSGETFHPPEGSFTAPPPSGSFNTPLPSGSFTAPPPSGDTGSVPPPSGSFSSPPPPSSQSRFIRFFGTLLAPFLR